MSKIAPLASTLIFLILFMATTGSSETKSGNQGLNWKFEYDDAGRITRLIDPGGKTISFRYEFDRAHPERIRRIVKMAAEDDSTIFVYDEFGRRVVMHSAGGRIRYQYGRSGLLQSVLRENMPPISYTYDTLNRLRSISVGEDSRVRYSYDFLGRLAKMRTPAGEVSYQYSNADGKIIRTLPNGIRTIREYNPDGSLKSIVHVDKASMLLSQFTYSYRPDGLISQIREWSPQGEKLLSYEYDAGQRLIVFTDSRGEKIIYTYDRLGNRTEANHSNGRVIRTDYDWAGRMIAYNGKECAHDSSGNLISYTSPKGERNFAYDGQNLLTEVDSGRVIYDYDGDGKLISRTVDGRKTTFLVNPTSDFWQPLLARGDDGEQTLFIWEGKNILAAINNAKIEFFLHDQAGSVRNIADQSGSVIKRLNYDPLGVPRPQIAGSALQPGHNGLFFDPEAGLYLTYFQTYDPFLTSSLQHSLPLQYYIQRDLINQK